LTEGDWYVEQPCPDLSSSNASFPGEQLSVGTHLELVSELRARPVLSVVSLGYLEFDDSRRGIGCFSSGSFGEGQASWEVVLVVLSPEMAGGQPLIFLGISHTHSSTVSDIGANMAQTKVGCLSPMSPSQHLLHFEVKESLRSRVAILGYGPDTSIYPLKDSYLLHYIV